MYKSLDKAKWARPLAVLVASVVVMGGSCDDHAVAPDTSTLLVSLDDVSQLFTKVYVGTIVGPSFLYAYDTQHRSIIIDVDWTSSNPAVLRLNSAASTQTGNGGHGASFITIAEGTADIIATPKGSVKTFTGQPVVYRKTFSVSGLPANVRISPAAPILLQVEDPAIVNSATEVSARATVTSTSGREMDNTQFTWKALDVNIAAFRQVGVGGTTQKLDGIVAYPSEVIRVIGVAPGLARMVATLNSSPDYPRPTRYADTVLVIVGGGQVVVSQTSVGPSELEVGEKAQFQAAVKDANNVAISNPTIRWSTSVPSLATVSQTGEVTATAAGADGDTVSVLANVPTLGVTGLLRFTIYRKVASISLTPTTINLVAGTSTGALARFKDAAGNAISSYRAAATWAMTTNPSIASIGSQLSFNRKADTVRVINAASAGDGTLTVSYPGATSASIPVHITSAIGSVFLTIPVAGGGSRPVVAVGEPLTIGSSLTLVGTSRDLLGLAVTEPVTFTTSTPTKVSITVVNANTATITGLAAGTGTVTVTSTGNTTVSATATFIVGAVVTGGPATHIDITSTPSDGIASIGATVSFRGIAKDVNNAVASDCPVGWSIDATGIASLNASGVATGISAGTTAVRAFCTDHGNIASAARLVVKDATFGVTQVNVAPRSVYLANSGSFTFTSTVIQTGVGAIAPVTWSLVPNNGVVTFDPLVPGRVIAPAAGVSAGGGVKVVATAAGQSDTAWMTYGNAGSIKGTVVSTSGQYLGASTATATPTGGGSSVITGLSNEGIFFLSGLPAGSYTVVVRQQGNPVAQTVTNVVVTIGGTTLLTLAPFP